MKILILAGILWVGGAAACGAKGIAECGSAPSLATLYYEVLYGADRQAANAELVQGLFPVVKCLSHMGYFATPPLLKGRYARALETLSILKQQPLRLNNAEAIDGHARLMKMNQAADR